MIKLIADCLKYYMKDRPLITKMREEYEFFNKMPHKNRVTLKDLNLENDLSIPMHDQEATDKALKKLKEKFDKV